MKIACLGWGSLVWRPGDLPIRRNWKKDGPDLPIEFARQSKDKRITLVICEGVQNVTALWVELDVLSLEHAKNALAMREGIQEINISKHIGFWVQERNSGSFIIPAITSWAEKYDLDAVLWTGLPPKINGPERVPTLGEVVDHLDSLTGETRKNAEEYIRRTPKQIATLYRRDIEERFGWTQTDSD